MKKSENQSIKKKKKKEVSRNQLVLGKVLERNMAQSKRACKVCQKHFIPHHGLQLICSHGCLLENELKYKKTLQDRKPKKDFGKVMCVVEDCNREFVKKTYNKLTCSKLCSLKNSYRLSRLYEKERIKKDVNYCRDKTRKYRESKVNPPLPKTCEYCKVKVIKVEKRGLNAKYCSRMCALQKKNEVDKEISSYKYYKEKVFDKWWEENKESILSKIKNCKICDKTFKAVKSQKTCGLKCSAELRKQTKQEIYQRRKEKFFVK